ncbi:MAG: hypothetical protein H7178_10990 [Chitinophagaceae bacterium]|nr:hypothetical protein [Chitinophagaceae bacterium]
MKKLKISCRRLLLIPGSLVYYLFKVITDKQFHKNTQQWSEAEFAKGKIIQTLEVGPCGELKHEAYKDEQLEKLRREISSVCPWVSLAIWLGLFIWLAW